MNPLEVATLSAFRRRPQAFYEFYRKRLAMLAGAAPNAAHHALVALEPFGLHAVVTQNVDGLHQAAGSRRVIELHGNLHQAACVDCRRIESIEALTHALDRGEFPTCGDCGGRLKPNVVLFEELLPETAYVAAEDEVRKADALLVAGSSLQVTPAAWLPQTAKAHGAAVIIANDEPTAMDHVADAVLRGRVGQMLPELVRAVADQRKERDASR